MKPIFPEAQNEDFFIKVLEADNLFAGYGKVEILHGVSVYLKEKETITIIGPNGAGKSTLMKALMGYISIFKGEITWKGEKVTYLKAHEKVKRGFGYVPQLGNVFPSMSVRENLEMGGFIKSKEILKEKTEQIFQLFPMLAGRLKQKAGTMSGGQRQMLGMARALMTDPEILMLDEPSAGLSPKVSEEVFSTIGITNHQIVFSLVVLQCNQKH